MRSHSRGDPASLQIPTLVQCFSDALLAHIVYAHDGNWVEGGERDDATTTRLNRSLTVLTELAE